MRTKGGEPKKIPVLMKPKITLTVHLTLKPRLVARIGNGN